MANPEEPPTSLMQRDPVLPSHLAVRFLTLAITIVVGFQFGPRLAAQASASAVIGCADQKVSEDAFKVGERTERRVVGAYLLDRLPALRPSNCPGAVPRVDQCLAPGASAFDARSQSERLPIVKHVPRMERGDPPRS